MIGLEEDSVCNREGCEGVIRLRPPENCSCHINPPCSACENRVLECPECGISEDDEEDWFEEDEDESEDWNLPDERDE